MGTVHKPPIPRPRRRRRAISANPNDGAENTAAHRSSQLQRKGA